MNTYHLLNGDFLAEQLTATKINKDFIICRECLIDGDLIAENMEAFWSIRAKFIANAYAINIEDYYTKTVSEFEKLLNLPNNTTVCLWFENDLFCQANMWFVISLLAKNSTLKLFRVFPIIKNNENPWQGFENERIENLELAFELKREFTKHDIEMSVNLWNAYKNKDFIKLKALSKIELDCYENLQIVCNAHIDRFPIDGTLGRPEKKIMEIMDAGVADFDGVFKLFSSTTGIYGFGDLQLKTIYNKLLKK